MIDSGEIKVSRPRDSQRSKLYKSEWEASSSYEKELSVFQSMSECQNYVDKILKSKWFRKHWPEVEEIYVNPGKGCVRANASRTVCEKRLYTKEGRIKEKKKYVVGEIKLPKWAREDWIILHEVCHVVTCYSKYAAHGREYASNYLKLVQHFIGKEYSDELKRAFKRNRVKYSKKKELTETHKEILRKNIAIARNAVKNKE